jgi:hypothetical protein
MKIKLGIGILAVLVIGFTVIIRNGMQSNYCYIGDPPPTNEGYVSSIFSNCKIGDTIPIPNYQVQVIGEVCDFSKSIVGVGDQNSLIMCVIGRRRKENFL